MKRSPYLVPLSWEHHSALVNANRIHKGIANEADVNIMQEFMEYVWQTDLQPHFEREERLLGGNRNWMDVAEDLRNHMLSDHDAMDTLMKTLIATQRLEEKEVILADFAQLLISHVRFEENELFPAIEELFEESDLEIIGQKLKEEHVPGCIAYKPAFWESKEKKPDKKE